MTEDKIVRDSQISAGWERVVGDGSEDSLVTCFSYEGWFDVNVWKRDNGKYDVELKRGPNHPKQDEIDEHLRRQLSIEQEAVETVAVAFMLCASDMDPFTNRFSRGYEIEE